MNVNGHIQNGTVVPDEPLALPDGTRVTIVVSDDQTSAVPQRTGGIWKGRVHIADDFDVLPDDIARAFGMEPE